MPCSSLRLQLYHEHLTCISTSNLDFRARSNSVFSMKLAQQWLLLNSTFLTCRRLYEHCLMSFSWWSCEVGMISFILESREPRHSEVTQLVICKAGIQIQLAPLSRLRILLSSQPKWYLHPLPAIFFCLLHAIFDCPLLPPTSLYSPSFSKPGTQTPRGASFPAVSFKYTQTLIRGGTHSGKLHSFVHFTCKTATAYMPKNYQLWFLYFPKVGSKDPWYQNNSRPLVNVLHRYLNRELRNIWKQTCLGTGSWFTFFFFFW